MSSRSSLASDQSSRSRRQYSKQWMDCKFTTNWEYFLINMGNSFSIYYFCSFIIINGDQNEPTIIHYLLCFLFIGLPLNYMQVLLGQYSQLGVIFFKHLSPIGHGVGYALLLNSLLWCSNYGIIMADFLMYLLTCLGTTLEWMSCPPNTYDRCWDRLSNCTKNCITKEIETSAYVYWKETFMNNPDLNPTQLRLGAPIWVRVVPLFLTWSIIFGLVSIGISSYKKLVRVNLYVASIFIITMLFLSFAAEGATKGVALMFRINFDSFLSASAWSYTVDKVVQNLVLARAGHMAFGSYMSPKIPSDILTIFSVIINFFGIFFMSMVTHACIGIIMNLAHLDESNVKHVYREGIVPYFTVLPEGLGFMGAAQMWTILYMLACICLLVNNLTIQIDVVHRSVANAHSRIRAYRNYLLVGICSFCFFIGFLFTSKESFAIAREVFERVLEHIRGFTLFTMCILTFWVYRVQRISDDIHFLQGAQPTKFWKILWYLAPAFIMFTYIYLTFIDPTRRVTDVYMVTHYVTWFIQIAPIPICFFIEIFRYLKIHNLVGILQPEERWGPPDPEERHLRHLFNPRQEIRSRRRDDTCQHNCLLGSKHLKKVVLEEKVLREAVIRKSSLQEPDEEYDIKSTDTWI